MPGRPSSVNAWLVPLDAGGWMLVDGGIDTDEAWSVLSAAIMATVGRDELKLNVITHMHVDHVGLVGRVRDAFGGALAMGELDATRRRHAAANPDEERDYRVAMLASNGAPEALVEAGAAAGRSAGGGPFTEVNLPLPSATETLSGAPEWVSVWTPGHTAGHTSLFRPRDGTLIAGDAVIPRVTPTIGVNRQRTDPVGDYLDTLDRLEALEPRVVLGGHGVELYGVDRIREIRTAVEAESRQIADLLGPEPLTAWQVVRMRHPGRDLPTGPWMQALREVRAHLDRLADQYVASHVEAEGPTEFVREATR